MMRISTQSLFETGTARLTELQSALAKTQQQIATGKRMLTPADDPIGAARALEVSQSEALNVQFERNRGYARNALVATEGALAGVTELLQMARVTAVAAGNPTLGNSERAFQATDLRARLDALIGLANARDAQGNYIFSGFQSDTPAFVKTLAGATYQGDAGQLLVQVDTNRQMAATATGQTVFQGGGQDMFQTLTTLANLLDTPVATPADEAALAAGLQSAVADLDLALRNVSTVRAGTGARLQELDALDVAGEDKALQYAQILSDLQDLDYTEALTRLTQQQFTLEAAQKSFATTSKMSLFNFI